MKSVIDSHAPSVDTIRTALAGVHDPEINRPITELGMVKDIQVGPGGRIDVAVYLTIAACPLRDRITRDVTAAVAAVPGVTDVRVTMDVMSDQQRAELRKS